MPPVASIAPIAPLNSAPVPMAAFGMNQAVPMQQMPTGIIPPLATAATTIPPIIPPIVPVAGNAAIDDLLQCEV